MALRRLVANRVLANASISEVKIAPEELTSNVILDNSINVSKLQIATFSEYDVTLNSITINGGAFSISNDGAITSNNYSITSDGVISGNGIGISDIQVANVTGLTTQNVPEHSSNLYFTETRARDSLSAGANITYDNTTGTVSVTDFTGDARGAIGAGPGITYNPATGVITVDEAYYVANVFALSANDYVSMLIYGQP